MKCGASCANYVIKILATLGSLACYLLLLGFWKSFETKYHRFVVCTILPGYSVLYIAFTFAVICGKGVDRGLNQVCAMLGVGAYWGAAVACWLHLVLEKKEIGKNYCLAAGGVAAFQVFILTVDVMFLMKDRRRKEPMKTMNTKIEHVKVQNPEPRPEPRLELSLPSVGGTPFSSAEGSTAPTKPVNPTAPQSLIVNPQNRPPAQTTIQQVQPKTEAKKNP